MTDLSSERNPVEALAEEFLERFRRGERPALSEYTGNYPELADEIRDLFPALVMLEEVRPNAGGAASEYPGNAATAGGKKLERLGDYRILREVGRGGMGIVYEAEQESLGRHVALKLLLGHALHDPRHLQRFQREARAAARLHHTNIVPVFGVGEHEGLHYYVMQFIQGQGLDQILAELQRLSNGAGHNKARAAEEQRTPATDLDDAASALAVARSLLSGVFAEPPQDDQPVPANQPKAPTAVASSSSSEVRTPLSDSGRPYWHSVARIGVQVAEALGYAHAQGTLHRDIKPANLLVDTQGNVWVTDFGLAKGHDSEDLTHTGDVVGTLRYLAPERFQGKADVRSDLYALGLTLYELMTLRPAFQEVDRSKLVHQVMHQEPPPPRKLNPLVPRDLETIVLKAIARDPAHRYQSAVELADDLHRFIEDKPIHARPVSEAEKLWRWGRRNPSLALLALLFIVTLTFGSAVIAWKWFEAEERRQDAENQKLNVIRAEGETARQRDEAIEARKTSQRVLAGALQDKGTNLAEMGEIGEGLFWMLEALKIAPEDNADLVRVIRTNLSAWTEHTHNMRHLIEHPRMVRWCMFSPDGKRFVTGSHETVQSWDTVSGRPAGAAIKLNADPCVALSPDGKTILTGTSLVNGKTPEAQCWDAATGKPIGAALPHPASIHAAAFTPDGKKFLTGGRDGKVRLWDAATGKLVGEPFRQDQVAVFGIDVSPDGKTLAIATSSRISPDGPGVGYLFDLATGKPIGSPLQHKATVRSVVFSPNGKTVLSTSFDGTAQLWDATTGLAAGPPLRHPHVVLAGRFTPDGRSIVTGCRDGLVRFWDAATCHEVGGALLVDKLGVQDVAISPDGSVLLAASGWELSSGMILVCQRPSNLSRPALKSRESALRASWVTHDNGGWFNRQFVSYSPDTRLTLTGGNDSFASMSDSASGQPAYLGGAAAGPFRHLWTSVRVTAFSPDGRFFATSSRDPSGRSDARLWDARTGRPIGLPLPQNNHVAAMAFSPDGKMLATGGYDRGVQLWDTATGARLGPILLQPDIVLTLAFSPDGKTLAVGHADDYSGNTGAVLWDVAGHKRIGQAMPGPHTTICFSPDSSRLLTGAGTTLRLWNAGTGAPLGPALIEPASINTVKFRPDGLMILLGCADGTVRLRDLPSGKTVGAPMLYPFSAETVAFSPDPQGKFILAGYADGSARIWDRATQKPLGPPVLQALPIYGITFTSDARSFLTTAADGNTRRWPVPTPRQEGIEQMALRLHVRTASEMGEGQTVVQLTPAEWHRRRQLLAARAALSDPALAFDSAFHEARARDAEQDGDWFAAKWHLDHLIAARNQEPEASAWLLYARRARCQMADGAHVDQAADDYERAHRLGSAAMMSNWYRHCLADCQAAKNWPAALWYLDRLITAEPNDWRHFADRAEVHAKLNRHPEHEADLGQAAKLGADSDFLVRLAETYAGRGEWQQSASAFALAHPRGPMPLAAAHAHVLICWKNGDHTGVRQICARLLKEADPTPPPDLANGLAWICVMGPDAVADYAPAVALAELALAKAPPSAKHDALNTLGAVLYRCGRYRDAIARLNEGIQARNGKGVVHDWIFLAMAHHRLGETTEARKFLAKAAPLAIENLPFSWERLEIDLLHREASALVEGAPVVPKGKGQPGR